MRLITPVGMTGIGRYGEIFVDTFDGDVVERSSGSDYKLLGKRRGDFGFRSNGSQCCWSDQQLQSERRASLKYRLCEPGVSTLILPALLSRVTGKHR